MIIIKGISSSLNLLRKDPEVRSHFMQPISKAFKVYSLTFLLSIFSLIFYFSFVSEYTSWWALILSILGAFLIIIIAPVVVTFLFFSFGCDTHYEALAGKFLKNKVYQKEEKEGESSIGNLALKSILIFFLIIVLLILSFFVPYVTLVFAGIIFSADVMSHSLSYLGLSYLEQFKYLSRNLLSVLVIGISGAILSLLPFAFLVVYPLWVMLGAYSIANNSNLKLAE